MRAWSAATTAPLPPTRASRVAWSAATLVALTARVAAFAAALHDRW